MESIADDVAGLEDQFQWKLAWATQRTCAWLENKVNAKFCWTVGKDACVILSEIWVLFQGLNCHLFLVWCSMKK